MNSDLLTGVLAVHYTSVHRGVVDRSRTPPWEVVDPMGEVHIRLEAWGTRRVVGILSTAVAVVGHTLTAEAEVHSRTEGVEDRPEVGHSHHIVGVEGRNFAVVEVHIHAVGLGQGSTTLSR